MTPTSVAETRAATAGPIALACPQCRGTLQSAGDTLHCRSCVRDWPLKNNTPFLTRDPPIWRFDSDEKSTAFLEQVQQRGWRNAVEEFYGEVSRSWIASAHRAEAMVLTKIDPNSVVVDAGCGWGALSFPMAQLAKHVYAIDSNPQGLEFIELRCRQESIGNLTPVGGDLLALPLPRSSHTEAAFSPRESAELRQAGKAPATQGCSKKLRRFRCAQPLCISFVADRTSRRWTTSSRLFT